MSKENASGKGRSSASGNEANAEIKQQILDNEVKLNEHTLKVEGIIAEQASLKEDVKTILESLKSLEKTVGNLHQEVKTKRDETFKVKIDPSITSMEEQYFDNEDFLTSNIKSSTSPHHEDNKNL